MSGNELDLAKFRAHVKKYSPAFVPLFQDQSRYQVAWGGAGCVHPDTKIHTEHGLMRICDIDRPMRVLSWNEKSRKFVLSLTGGAFPKGKDYLYQVTTERGVFQSSGHHLVLLSTGEYRRVDNLLSGDVLNQAQSCRHQTIEECCRLLSREDELRYSQKASDSMGDYANECRRYDPQPHEQGDYALFSGQQQGDAQEHDRSYLPFPCVYRGISRLRNHLYLYVGRIYKKRFFRSALSRFSFLVNHVFSSSFECISRSRLVTPLFQSTIFCRHSKGLTFQGEQGLSCSLGSSFDESKHKKEPVLSSSTCIKSITRSDKSEYWCMQVLDTNNYVSEDGTVHHNSGKSHIIARKKLYRLLKEDHVKHNMLIIRKVDRTIKKSVWTLMKNIISKWGLYDDFKMNVTDRTMIWKHNGSQFMFSGLDDVEKLKSIEGVTSIWIEEATELTQEDFEQLDLRLRGKIPCLKQIILSLNPISEQHWIKKVFFDDPIDGAYTLKTTYLDNHFIDEEYKMVMENKKKTNIRYYNIYALGNWGTAEGLIFQNIQHRAIRPDEIKYLECLQGLDFGYTNDPSAFVQVYVDRKNNKLYIYDGFYEKGLSNKAIADNIIELKAHKHKTIADSSEPKSIDSLKDKGVKVTGAAKGRDSINAGIDLLLEYEIIVNAHLVEFMTEFNNYSWAIDKKTNKQLNKPVDDFNHFIDALRYATECLQVNKQSMYDKLAG